ncbi:MAG: glutathione S-transferase [Deltaproteobacteria bacterium]|nr:glutathione S-transferase [Deltaproteobacteria bacterium]
MRLWGRRSAFNVQKALWTLGELGLSFEHVDAGGDAGGLDRPAFLAMNPHGRIPVLEDGDVVVWESHAIVRYLAARHAVGTLWPEDPAARSEADRWMDWSQTTLQPDFMALFWGYYRTPESQRNEQRIAAAAQSCAAHFEKLDAHLAGRRFVAGDSFTMGDVPAGTALHRYFEMGYLVPEPPHVRAWHARLAEREPFRTHVQRPFDELRGRLDF